MQRPRRSLYSPSLKARSFNSPSLYVNLAIFAVWSFLLFGGGGRTDGLRLGIMLVTGAACVIAFGSRGGIKKLGQLPLIEALCLLTLIAIPLLQLIPLPPSVWTALPGRSTETEIFFLADQSVSWLPMTLNRTATLSALGIILSLGGIVLAGITLGEKAIRQILIATMVFVALSLVVGAVQLSSSGKLLTFYTTSHKGLLLGFFSNRNHQALLIAISILIAGYLIGTSRVPTRQRLALFGFYVFVALAAAFATASRMGLALCLAASFAVPFLFLGASMARKAYVLTATAGLVVILAGIVGLSGSAGRALDRYGDVGGDYRWTIWERSVAVMRDYFPFGTGLGSFSDVYQKYEQLEWLLPNYVNDVHNDYIQLIIETGAPGVLLLLILLAVLFRAALLNAPLSSGQKTGSSALAKLGIGIILMTLVHSVVDYPLHRPAISVTFAIALALIFRQRLRRGTVDQKVAEPAVA